MPESPHPSYFSRDRAPSPENLGPWPEDVPIYVYLPAEFWPTVPLPESPGDYWPWQQANWGQYNKGLYDWTLQTSLQLRTAGVPCALVDQLPEDGIILTTPPGFAAGARPGRRQYWVCIVGDKGRHRWTHLHVVQNPHDDIFQKPRDLWPAFSTPFWVQPSLTPRSPDRGDRFEVAAYFGRERELDPALRDRSWGDRVAELGLTWRVIPPEAWHDYRTVDVAIAARGFGPGARFNWKPPSKLVNAWHGQVPAILNREDGFRSLRRSELDYIEVRSPEEILAALQKLRDDPALRRAMVANGRDRAEEVNNRTIAHLWQRELLTVAVPGYRRWRRWSGGQQTLFFALRTLADWGDRSKATLRRWRGRLTGPLKAWLRPHR